MPGLSRGVLVCLLTIAVGCSATDGLAAALTSYGLGHLPEIVEGDAPHRPVGCFAQAWSDAEYFSTLGL